MGSTSAGRLGRAITLVGHTLPRRGSLGSVDSRLEAELPGRRERLAERLESAGLDALFVPPSADLEYLTGIARDLPTFGEISYAHGWATGAFVVPGREPLFVLPRMVVAFHLGGEAPGDAVVVAETDDGEALFRAAIARLGKIRRLGIGTRTWARTTLELLAALPGVELVDGGPLVERLRRVKSALELELMEAACSVADDAMAAVAPRVAPGVTMRDLQEDVEHELSVRGSRCPSFPTHIFTWQGHDSSDATAVEPVGEGACVMFDFGAVHAGYCSDFGRTVVAGEPPPGYLDAYAVMLAAQEAGRAALVPGAVARDVNAACRAPIEEAGLGAAFRHRMGHGIGMDVHERPFLSPEDETVLEPGMAFTDEPSLLLDGRFGVRIEDVVTCASGGGRRLNRLGPGPLALV
jgi:Xaa-Pro aminopeptidase